MKYIKSSSRLSNRDYVNKRGLGLYRSKSSRETHRDPPLQKDLNLLWQLNLYPRVQKHFYCILYLFKVPSFQQDLFSKGAVFVGPICICFDRFSANFKLSQCLILFFGFSELFLSKMRLKKALLTQKLQRCTP